MPRVTGGASSPSSGDAAHVATDGVSMMGGLKKQCTNCGTWNNANANTCTKCGACIKKGGCN